MHLYYAARLPSMKETLRAHIFASALGLLKSSSLRIWIVRRLIEFPESDRPSATIENQKPGSPIKWCIYAVRDVRAV